MTDYTKQLSKYLVDLQYQDIPADVIERGKMLTMHCVGAALAAKGLYTAKSSAAAAHDLVGRNPEAQATLWGSSRKIPFLGAIFANATASDTLDWEDCSWTGHPTASMIPVALTMCETYNKTGRDYLTAMIGGFEVYQRIAGYIQPPEDWDQVKKGWGLYTWQIFSASMPAGKLMNCNEEQTNLLIGGTGCMTPVVNTIGQKQMSDFYHLQFGFVSLNGAMLALMAKRDELDNMYDILDVEGGYSDMMRGFANDGWLDRNLGTEYMFNEILFKHWPANMWVQTPLDCLDALRREHGFTAADIESIFISPGVQYRDRYCPQGYSSVKEGQFSTPYCLAAYMLDHRSGPAWFSDEKLHDPQLLELAGRVHLDKENTLSLSKCFKIFTGGSFPKISMTLTLKDGRVFERDFQFPLGHPRNPYTWEECEKDFRIGAEVVGLSQEKQDKFIRLCRDLENVTDVAEMAGCLATDE